MIEKIERRTCNYCESTKEHDGTKYAGGALPFGAWIHVHGRVGDDTRRDDFGRPIISVTTLDFCSQACLRNYFARSVSQLSDILPLLSADERMDLFEPYCKSCGCDERVLGHACYCERDE